jgi:hypothetical protein
MTDDASLSARMHKKKAELEASKWSDLSIADRLTIRALEQKITVPFESEQGIIDVELRLPNLAEFDFLSTFEIRWKNYLSKGDGKEALNLSDEMFKIMESLCIDESLNEEFFRAGYISATDFTQLVKEVLVEHRKRSDEVKSFRDPKLRTPSTVRVPRKAPA